jgi:hypothetical protein
LNELQNRGCFGFQHAFHEQLALSIRSCRHHFRCREDSLTQFHFREFSEKAFFKPLPISLI